MKYVLFYESADDVADNAPRHFAAHQARWHQFRASGTLLLIGPFTDQSGAMGVFTTRAAAEDFVAGDPFMLHGVIRNWYIREWMEAIDTR